MQSTDHIKVWPAIGMKINLEYCAPGVPVDVQNEDAIGLIGAEPEASHFLRLDTYVGRDVTYNAVIGGKWAKDISKEEADAVVDGFEAPVTEEEDEKPAAKKGRKAKS